jgi:hypothetical protein
MNTAALVGKSNSPDLTLAYAASEVLPDFRNFIFPFLP